MPLNITEPGSIQAMIAAALAVLIGGWYIYRIVRPELDKVDKKQHRELEASEKQLLSTHLNFRIVLARRFFLASIALLIFGVIAFVSFPNPEWIVLEYIIGMSILFPFFGIGISLIYYLNGSSSLDLKDKVYRIEGKVFKNFRFINGKEIWGFKVGKYSFDYENVLVPQNNDEFYDGDIVSIEFSPKSHAVWSIKKIK